jgi:hypothetical protein
LTVREAPERQSRYPAGTATARVLSSTRPPPACPLRFWRSLEAPLRRIGEENPTIFATSFLARPPGMVRRRCAQDNPRIFATRLPSVPQQTFPWEAGSCSTASGCHSRQRSTRISSSHRLRSRVRSTRARPLAQALPAGCGRRGDGFTDRVQLAKLYRSALPVALFTAWPTRGPVQSAFGKYIGGCFWSYTRSSVEFRL